MNTPQTPEQLTVKRQIWKNIVSYVAACIECERDAESPADGKRLNDAMYSFLEDNYAIRRKVKKATIFTQQTNL